MFCVKFLLDFLVLIGELFGLLNHSIDFFLGQTSLVVGNCNRFLLSSSFFMGVDGKDTIFIDFECDFNLRCSTRSWRESSEVEVTKLVIILDESTFTLKYRDVYLSLLIGVGGEGLGLFGGDDGTTFDDV